MFGSKKLDPNPLGVPLGYLLLVLAPTSIKASLMVNGLLARHEHYTIRIEVVPPKNRESENGPIRAVVQMITELPSKFVTMLKGREADATAAFNAFAGLGALYPDEGTIRIGSRLTIYEKDDAWKKLHLPLLFVTTVCGTEAILGGVRRVMGKEGNRGGDSEWTEDDFEQVENYLSRLFLCTRGGLGLTAEFGLTEGAISATAGTRNTALFQMMADQPHPELGGGLFCVLQMPHQVTDEKDLQEVCVQLNKLEMAPQDLTPHFGAWCPGKLGNNPAYVSFLPNALHSVAPGIALNYAIWAIFRAKWASAKLEAMGLRF